MAEDVKLTSLDGQNRVVQPSEYFDYLKSVGIHQTNENLDTLEGILSIELSRAKATGQTLMFKRLAFMASVLLKERELLSIGIDKYVMRSDIEKYVNAVENKTVKIIDIERYTRTIPDEIAEQLQALRERNIFDKFFVVFTDYTGEIERQVEKERRDKDPIVFGAFSQPIGDGVDIHDRFYYIADWIDEYCDLTLSKMVDEMAKKGVDIIHPVGLKELSREEVKAYLHSLQEDSKGRLHVTNSLRKKSFFDKVKTTIREWLV